MKSEYTLLVPYGKIESKKSIVPKTKTETCGGEKCLEEGHVVSYLHSGTQGQKNPKTMKQVNRRKQRERSQ